MKVNTLLILSVSGALVSGASAQFNTLSPWGNAVGTTPAPSFTSDGTTSTVTAGGADFWGDNDEGAFLWDNGGAFTTTGDFTATVRHVSTTTPAPTWGRDGILVRSTAGGTPGAPQANDPNFMAIRLSNGNVEAGVRNLRGTGGTTEALSGGNPGGISFGSVANTPVFLSSSREGSTLRTGYARDLGGVAGRWILHGTHTSANFNAGQQVVVGLGHQSHPQTISPDTNDINTATFDNWSFQGSYNAARFGAASSPGTWQPVATYTPTSDGQIRGSAYIREGGVATGEAVLWRTKVETVGSTAMPGLQADIYLAGNPGTLSGVRAIIGNAAAPAGTTIIPNVDWTGNGGTSATNAAPYNQGEASGVFSDAVPGQFAGTNQENYGVHMRGQIFVPSDVDRSGLESIRFKDGIDDYTYLNIDGVALIDDNGWTGYNGAENGGSPIVSLDVSNSKFDDGEWVSFEMITWEGGGGDAGALYWDVADGDANFPAAPDTGANTNDLVPAANFRHFAIDSDNPTFQSGLTQIGDENGTGVFGSLANGDYFVTVVNNNTGAEAGAGSLVSVVPEPSAPLFIGLGAMALLLRRRNRR